MEYLQCSGYVVDNLDEVVMFLMVVMNVFEGKREPGIEDTESRARAPN